MNASTQTAPAVRVIGLADLEVGARVYSAARTELAGHITALQEDITAAKLRYKVLIEASMRAYKDAESALRSDVELAPAVLFVKPRTYQFHGVKMGRQKGKGGLQLQFDDAQTVALIRKHLADQADALIIVKESPAKEALENLPAADLKKLGIHIAVAGDQIVLKAVDTDIEKLIKALSGDLAMPAEVES